MATDVSALSGRISTTEANISGALQRLSSVELGVEGRALLTDFNTLRAEIVAARGLSPSLSAEITNVLTVSINATNVVAQDVSLLSGRVSTAEGTLSGAISRLATVEVDVGTRVLTSTYNQLVAEIVEARAGRPSLYGHILEINTALVTQDGVLLTAINQVSGRVTTEQGRIDGAISRLNSLDLTVGGLATVTSLNALALTVSGINGTVSGHTNQLSQITGDLAGNIGVTNSIGQEVTLARGTQPTLASQLAYIFTTAIEGNTATNTVLQAQIVRIGAAEGSITSLSQAVANIDGRVSLRTSVLLDNNGYISGTISDNDGSRSTTKFLTDEFEVSDPSGNVGKLVIADGTITTFYPNGQPSFRAGNI